MSNSIRNEVNKLAQQIEDLARQVQAKLSTGDDPMMLANELVRSNSVFVFALGQMYADSNSKTVKTVTVSNPNNTKARKYHNVRDSLGRFTRV